MEPADSPLGKLVACSNWVSAPINTTSTTSTFFWRSVGASFIAAFLFSDLCSVSKTYASPHSLIGASFATAFLGLSSVPNANPSSHGDVGASFVAAFFVVLLHLCPMPPTYSSFHNLISTSFRGASFDLCPMSLAGATLLDEKVASFFIAFLLCPCCPMTNADASLHNKISASVVATFFVVRVLH